MLCSRLVQESGSWEKGWRGALDQTFRPVPGQDLGLGAKGPPLNRP